MLHPSKCFIVPSHPPSPTIHHHSPSSITHYPRPPSIPHPTAKAAGAIKRYGVDAVVANNLLTYKDKVVLIRCKPGTTPEQVVVEATRIAGDETEPIAVRGISQEELKRQEGLEDIESIMIPKLVEMHGDYAGAASIRGRL
jgi:hypothetical protein